MAGTPPGSGTVVGGGDQPARLKALFTMAAIAAGYALAGWLGLLFVLPPGYATAVWPASGVALAAALLAGGRTAGAGIWMGSFLLNLRFGLSTDSVLETLGTLTVSAVIATGAVLQAVAGAWLIRRFVGYHNLLVQELDVVRLLVLGGPVACLISASLGIVTLWMAGVIPDSAVAYHWWTWWVGDVIGILVFTPLVLVWSVRPYQDWFDRQVAVSLPLVLLFVVVVGLFMFTSQREQERIEQDVHAMVGDAGERLRREVGAYLQALYAIRGLYSTAQGINRRQFESFGLALIEPLPAIEALQWAPLVPDTVKNRFEASVQADGVQGFRITEFDADGQRVPAVQRAHYFPIHYVAPYRGNEWRLGYDMASHPARASALFQARDTGQPVMTPVVQLLSGERGILAVLPVYWYGFPQDSVSTRRQNLHGYAVAAIRIDAMLTTLNELLQQSDAFYRLYDDAAPAAERLFYESPGTPTTTDVYSHSLPLFIAGRPWQIEVILPAASLLARRSWQSWAVLAVGMLLTGMIGIMLLLAVGRTARIQILVEERTAELRKLNQNMAEEIELRRRLEGEAEQRAGQLAETNQELQRRDDLNRELLHNLRRSETALRRTASELAASNRELEQFAYVASHDLKAPLRTISSFSQLLEKRYTKKLDGEALEFLGFIADGIRQMQRLIDDLLQLSRVDARSLQIGRVEMKAMAEKVCRNISSDLDAAGARVTIGALPEVMGDPGLLAQLLQNLIGNGVKFQRQGVRPEIRIDARPEGNAWHFTVADNGIGIAENHLSQIFMIFKRLHTTDQYPGTGIGLAICRKVVQLHGGEIWATSVPGEGTTIHFTLPQYAEAENEDSFPRAAAG
jgi:signal transduction histidine kinase/integral membrane sensor domain MASE1